ncbi:TonB-dependent receptor domain-containing protein [Chitinibacteraceae bacterium HSL-7]
MKRFTIRPIPMLLATLASASASALADDVATLDTVVVTASGYEQEVKEAPASISVITREQLEEKPYTNLEDAVRDVVGVSISGGATNDKDIQIRGLGGDYTLILVDGKRQNTRETSNRASGGVQSSLLPPLEAIERIEVIRGPMSSLYGSDAMGGVINIITRKVGKAWQGSVSTSATLQEDSRYGNTTEGNFWLSGPLKQDLLGLQVWGAYSDRDEDAIHYANDPVSTGHYGEVNHNVAARLTLTPTKNQDILLEAGQSYLGYDSTVGNTTIPSATAKNTSDDYDRTYWSITHNGRWDFGATALAVYQEKGTESTQTLGAKDMADREIVNTTVDASATLPFTRHILKVGGQYLHHEVSGLATEAPITIRGQTVAAYQSPDRVTAHSYALFVEDEFSVTDRLTLTGGLRLEDSDRYGAHWTPRLYAVYALTGEWTLRGGVAGGYKAPTLRQSTEGYCMTTGRAGSGLRPGTLCGNPDLEPEESLSSEIGIRYDGAGGRSFSATLFNNDFDHKVVSYDTGIADPNVKGYNIYVYDNLDSATIRGLELTGSWPLARSVMLSANYTYTDSSREGGKEPAYDGSSLDGQPIARVPEHMANVQLDWTPTAALRSYVLAQYRGEEQWAAFRNGANTTRTRGESLTFDLGASYQLNKTFSVAAAVLNVADEIVPVDTRTRAQGLDGNWMVDEGRRYWLKLDAKF